MDTSQEQQSQGCFALLFGAVAFIFRWSLAYTLLAVVRWTFYLTEGSLSLYSWSAEQFVGVVLLTAGVMICIGFVPLTLVFSVIGDARRISAVVAILICVLVGTLAQGSLLLWSSLIEWMWNLSFAAIMWGFEAWNSALKGRR